METNVDVNGLRIHYRVEGDGDPVVLVHGWPASSALWRKQIPAIAERSRVYALDLPGLGDSDKPLDVRYTLDFHVSVLTGFLDALDIERAAFVCHDLGGPCVLLFAIRHPERVERLVVTDTIAHPDSVPLLMRVLLRAIAIPGLGPAIASRFGIRQMFRLGTATGEVSIPELADLYYRPYAENREARKALRRLLTDVDLSDLTEIADNLSRIEAPSLILWAAKDPTAPLAIARRLHDEISGSVLEVIPDCGHFMQEDQPEIVSNHLARFLHASD